MPKFNLIESIVAKSEENIVWLLSSQKPRTFEELLKVADNVCYNNCVPMFPYFANRSFKLESQFADFYIRRLVRRNFVQTSPLELTPRGKTLKFSAPIDQPVIDRKEAMELPFTTLPPYQLTLGNKKAKVKPLIDEASLIMCSLLPLHPALFCIFSHYHPGAMRTAYPLMKDGDTYLALDTGDVRNITTFPTGAVLQEAYQSFANYLELYCKDYLRYVHIVTNLLLSVGSIHFSHLCNQQLKTLNRLDDRVQLLLDFVPLCPECNMEANQHLNLISIRHSLIRAWEKGVLSELFFSKFVVGAALKMDPSVEVYPRLMIEGLSHECDIFVKKDDLVVLFELKRSTTYDGWCTEGIEQLNENKAVLEKWGLKCKTALVTNIESGNSPSGEVDAHLTPRDLEKISSIVENLLS